MHPLSSPLPLSGTLTTLSLLTATAALLPLLPPLLPFTEALYGSKVATPGTGQECLQAGSNSKLNNIVCTYE
jgi:hypothetical protein